MVTVTSAWHVPEISHSWQESRRSAETMLSSLGTVRHSYQFWEWQKPSQVPVPGASRGPLCKQVFTKGKPSRAWGPALALSSVFMCHLSVQHLIGVWEPELTRLTEFLVFAVNLSHPRPWPLSVVGSSHFLLRPQSLGVLWLLPCCLTCPLGNLVSATFRQHQFGIKQSQTVVDGGRGRPPSVTVESGPAGGLAAPTPKTSGLRMSVSSPART